MGKFSEAYGDINQYHETGGDFDLLPDGAFVVAEITEAPGKVNKNGTAYPVITCKVTHIQEGLTGNFGSPKLWDHSNFAVPPVPDPTLPEEELNKAKGRVGAWLRRVRILGLNPEDVDTAWGAGDAAAFYAPAIGKTVIVKVRQEPASGQYRAKNSPRDYYADTPEKRAKHKITVQVGAGDASFDPDKMEL